ncbi:MAG: YlxR family protein [Deltaproteobacteria bacterium]|nr:MAG: YlxR family protein [Deltaproteobacteria bacterium]
MLRRRSGRKKRKKQRRPLKLKRGPRLQSRRDDLKRWKRLKRGHRPQRTCLGCGTRDDQGKLLRFVLRADGELRLDRLGEGRGGYLHKTEECWQSFLRKKSLYRSLRSEIGREARERLVLTLRQSVAGARDGKDKSSPTGQGTGNRA